MEKKYKILKVYDLESGVTERGAWSSRDVVVEEVNDSVKYPDQLVLRLKGEKAQKFSRKEGEVVNIAYSTRVTYFTVKKGTPDERKIPQTVCDCWKVELAERDIFGEDKEF